MLALAGPEHRKIVDEEDVFGIGLHVVPEFDLHAVDLGGDSDLANLANLADLADLAPLIDFLHPDEAGIFDD